MPDTSVIGLPSYIELGLYFIDKNELNDKTLFKDFF
ncbi:hypothetical protein SAMN00777080_5062 [Aquiflexum balticum DSM 16537]|uniref:Uncharacterized protein n=1 Tax=Aquiflexum balticum DSM 16537 TaxID=758820 RepID=A0A1W2HBZ1_9BACT|nr:hypothetical protein SAMN00777080_5062 [Aquiflexum balticum DSM 16537]